MFYRLLYSVLAFLSGGSGKGDVSVTGPADRGGGGARARALTHHAVESSNAYRCASPTGRTQRRR